MISEVRGRQHEVVGMNFVTGDVTVELQQEAKFYLVSGIIYHGSVQPRAKHRTTLQLPDLELLVPLYTLCHAHTWYRCR